MKMSTEFLQTLCYWKNLLGTVRYFWNLFLQSEVYINMQTIYLLLEKSWLAVNFKAKDRNKDFINYVILFSHDSAGF